MLRFWHGGRKNLGFLGHDSSALTPQQQQERRQLRYELDLNSFNWKIWGVAASGFLTDSYNLFATNVILTSLAFVYWPDSGVHWQAMLVNVVTLFGSVCGQLSFGALADYYGRTRLYGIELVLMIVSTIGIAANRADYGSMEFLPPFLWWRFVMGIGVGAEYPLSSVITAEWSSTQARAKMMAAVFTMQPIGQALAQMVGMWVLLRWDAAYGIDAKQCGLNSLYDDECKQFVDMIWRIVVGSGAIPAVLAIIFRFYLFDSGVYKFDVEDRPEEAMTNTYRVYGTRDYDTQAPREPLLEQPVPKERGRGQDMPVQFSVANLRKFFIEDGNYMYLIGTAATWFLLDVTFFGLALDNRATLADMWAIKNEPLIDDQLSCWYSSLEGGVSPVPGWAKAGLPVWQTDGKHPCTTIYDVLFEQAVQYLLAVSIGSILGSLCFVLIVDRVPRRQWLVASFAILAALLFITGIVCYCVFETPRAPATIICLGISLFMFNCGPNPLNFIIPAEIFPTAYRCTCHGISAAAGKTGSILAILLIYVINDSYKSTSRQGLILLLFCAVAALGSICAWAYLPEVQRHVRVGPKGEIHRDSSIENPEAGGGRKRRNQARDGNGRDQDDYKDEDDEDDEDDEGEIGVEERKHMHRNWLTFWREDAMLENETLEELGEGRRRALQEGQVFSLEDRFADLKRRKIWRWTQSLTGSSPQAP